MTYSEVSSYCPFYQPIKIVWSKDRPSRRLRRLIDCTTYGIRILRFYTPRTPKHCIWLLSSCLDIYQIPLSQNIVSDLCQVVISNQGVCLDKPPKLGEFTEHIVHVREFNAHRRAASLPPNLKAAVVCLNVVCLCGRMSFSPTSLSPTPFLEPAANNCIFR